MGRVTYGSGTWFRSLRLLFHVGIIDGRGRKKGG